MSSRFRAVDSLVSGCAPGAKTINHQATGSRMRTWRKNYQPSSNRFQDAHLAQKLSTIKQPVPGCVPVIHRATGSRMRTWRKNYQPPSRRFQDAHLAQKLSTTKPPVPGCVPGAKTINHQAAGSRMRTWCDFGNQCFATCNVTR